MSDTLKQSRAKSESESDGLPKQSLLAGEKLSVLALSLSKALSPGKIFKTATKLGSFDEMLSLSNSEAQKRQLVKKGKTYEGKALLLAAASKVLGFCEKNSIQSVAHNEESFPGILREIDHCPLFLYYRGVLPSCGWENCVSIVGTRRSDGFMNTFTENLAYAISKQGGYVISGLALGIDSAAHKGALKAGANAAVLAGGVDYIYPYSNRKLYWDILEKGGCILSEHAPEVRPLAYHFPIRNRIISGLSKSIVMVQSPLKSGASITVRYALDQGRDIYTFNLGMAAEGAESEAYQGNLNLLAEGAIPIHSAQDFLEKAGFVMATKKTSLDTSKTNSKTNKILVKTDPKQAVLLEISQFPLSLAQLSARFELSADKLMEHLMELRLEGKVDSSKGRYYKL